MRTSNIWRIGLPHKKGMIYNKEVCVSWFRLYACPLPGELHRWLCRRSAVSWGGLWCGSILGGSRTCPPLRNGLDWWSAHLGLYNLTHTHTERGSVRITFSNRFTVAIHHTAVGLWKAEPRRHMCLQEWHSVWWERPRKLYNVKMYGRLLELMRAFMWWCFSFYTQFKQTQNLPDLKRWLTCKNIIVSAKKKRKKGGRGGGRGSIYMLFFVGNFLSWVYIQGNYQGKSMRARGQELLYFRRKYCCTIKI